MKIINNDDLLDKWVEKKSKEVEDRASKSNGKVGIVRNALDHDELIVFEDADDIYYDDDSYMDAGENEIKYDGVDYDD